MASANYASSDNSEELKLDGQDVNLVGNVMERDMTPLVNNWDQAGQASDWSNEVEELSTSGAGGETRLEEAEGFNKTTEGGEEAECFKETMEGGDDKSRESGEESRGVTGQGNPGKVLTSAEVTISSVVYQNLSFSVLG